MIGYCEGYKLILFISGFRTDKRPVSSFAAPTVSPVPHPLPRAMTVMAGRNASKQTNSKPSGGGLWPPPVSFPGRLSVSPDPGKRTEIS